ncbi:MAG TPA: aldolase/citrate lyase family protein, partial [Nitrososphaera sp.]|nr:aldolase/citrate lyase family protein [Nitrososphaera sp.]
MDVARRKETAEKFRKRMRAGEALAGTLVTLPSPAVTETLSRVGYDWLWIDMEHAPLSLDQVQSILSAKAESCLGFVRVPNNDETWIKQVLDLGADGIIVPQVKTAAEAKRAVA